MVLTKSRPNSRSDFHPPKMPKLHSTAMLLKVVAVFYELSLALQLVLEYFLRKKHKSYCWCLSLSDSWPNLLHEVEEWRAQSLLLLNSFLLLIDMTGHLVPILLEVSSLFLKHYKTRFNVACKMKLLQHHRNSPLQFFPPKSNWPHGFLHSLCNHSSV